MSDLFQVKGIAHAIGKTRQQVIYLIRKHGVKPVEYRRTFSNDATAFYSPCQFSML